MCAGRGPPTFDNYFPSLKPHDGVDLGTQANTIGLHLSRGDDGVANTSSTDIVEGSGPLFACDHPSYCHPKRPYSESKLQLQCKF